LLERHVFWPVIVDGIMAQCSFDHGMAERKTAVAQDAIRGRNPLGKEHVGAGLLLQVF